jgi:ankyrin repeat protein
MVAASRHRPSTLSALLAAGAPVNERNSWGSTALTLWDRTIPRPSYSESEWLKYISSEADCLDVLKQLLAAGADVDAERRGGFCYDARKSNFGPLKAFDSGKLYAAEGGFGYQTLLEQCALAIQTQPR